MSDLYNYIAHVAPCIDEHGKYLFFANRKVCWTSMVRRVWKRTIYAHKDSHTGWNRRFHSYTEEQILSMFKFSFVRNPWDRCLSAFCYINQSHVPKNPAYFAEHFDRSFESFIIEIFSKHGVGINRHFEYQYPNVFFEGKMFLDFLGRFENLAEDWEYLTTKVEVPKAFKTLPRKNTSQHDVYWEHYTDETREIVGNIYQDDIKLLGYTFGD